MDMTYTEKENWPIFWKAFADIEGIEWIRLHYAYPSDFPIELADVISNNPKICNYLDIPLQHISDSITQIDEPWRYRRKNPPVCLKHFAKKIRELLSAPRLLSDIRMKPMNILKS